MPDPTSFALFCAAALVLAVTPGPASVRRLREASGAAMIALGSASPSRGGPPPDARSNQGRRPCI